LHKYFTKEDSKILKKADSSPLRINSSSYLYNKFCTKNNENSKPEPDMSKYLSIIKNKEMESKSDSVKRNQIQDIKTENLSNRKYFLDNNEMINNQDIKSMVKDRDKLKDLLNFKLINKDSNQLQIEILEKSPKEINYTSQNESKRKLHEDKFIPSKGLFTMKNYNGSSLMLQNKKSENKQNSKKLSYESNNSIIDYPLDQKENCIEKVNYSSFER